MEPATQPPQRRELPPPRRPRILTVVGVLGFLGGLSTVLGAGLRLDGATAETSATLPLLWRLVQVVMGVLFCWSAVLVLRGRSARPLALYLVVETVLQLLALILSGGAGVDLFVVNLAISALVLWLLHREQWWFLAMRAATPSVACAGLAPRHP